MTPLSGVDRGKVCGRIARMGLIEEAIETGEDFADQGIKEIDIPVRDIDDIVGMEQGIDELLGGLEERKLSLDRDQARKIDWHSWDEPLTVKAEKKDGSFAITSAITIDNGLYGETFRLEANRVNLSAFQITEGGTFPTALVGRSQEEDHSYIVSQSIVFEWAGIIGRLTTSDVVDRVENRK